MKIVNTAFGVTINELLSDVEIISHIDCAGTAAAGGATILTPTTYRTIVIAKRIDASNFAINLPNAIDGALVEVYADGGSIEIFPGFAGPIPLSAFFDGSSSVVTSVSAKFRRLNALWARMD